jgi:SMP-30/Gluconolactonase/LRE-like region
MSVAEVVVCSTTAGHLSEGPRWHEDAGELLWVDILGAKFHLGSIATDGSLDRVTSVAIDRHIGAVAPVVGGGYVLAAGTGFLFVDAAGTVGELAQPEAGRTDVRMNDGACDPQGRFWAGTMAYDESPGAGVLYRLELDGGCTTVLTGLSISNGIGWSPDGATMYLADSGTGRVEAFDFDGGTGAISGRRTLVHMEQPGVAPMGSPSTRKGGSGRRSGAVARSIATQPTGPVWPQCGCPSSDRPRARSGGRTVPRCSSPPPEPGSTRPPWPASPGWPRVTHRRPRRSWRALREEGT